MPLSKGKSEKAFKKNVRTEYEEGKPLKQSLAIAYSMKKKAKKMADGGRVKESKNMHGGYEEDMGPTGPTGYSNRNKNSDMSGGQRKGPEGYPRYQESASNEKGVHTPVSGVTQFPGGKGTSRAGSYTKERYAGKPLFEGKDHPAKEEHRKVLGEMRSQKTGYFADGGQVKDNYQSSCSAHCESPCAIHPQAEWMPEHEGDVKRPNGPAMSEDDRELNQHGEHEEGREGDEGRYAEGGGVHPTSEMGKYADEKNGEFKGERGESRVGTLVRLGAKDLAKGEHKRVLNELRSDRKDRKFMADGGQITDNYADTEDGDGRDMVGRIMAQRQQEYSKGGQVANNTDQGYETGERRDDMGTGQYDDLVLRDDDMEDADYTGANSGDERGSDAEDARRKDIVSRIMNSRKKKDKLPNPR